MTEKFNYKPVDIREQAEDAAADLLAGEKAKSLIWDDGGDIGVEYFYVNSQGVLVIHKAFVDKIDEWLENSGALGCDARGLLEHLFSGCVFKGDSE